MKKAMLSILVAVLLCAAFALLPGKISAATIVDSGTCGASGENLTWTLDSDGLLVISGTGQMNDYSASSTAPWGDSVSKSARIKSVKIENGVTSIGKFAFSGCKGFTSVTIPNSVTSIGAGAFYQCTGLTDVTVPDSVKSIGSSAFSGCTGLVNAKLPNYVTSFGDSIFYGCTKLTSVTIPNGLSSIRDSMFYNCTELTNVTLPNSVTSINDRAFAHCKGLTNVTIPNGVTSIGLNAFYHCTGLTGIIIPNSVTNIDDYAFTGCTRLTSVMIGNGVTRIGSFSFADCMELTSVTIPNSVTSIESSAFEGCMGLTSVTIPKSVQSIGTEAFLYCSGLKKVEINDLSVWCILNFSNSSANPLFYAHHLYLNGKEITDLIIPSGVMSIGRNAFYHCTGLTNITIPDSVTNIGDYAFSGCTGLKSVTIPKSVTSIGGSAFDGCTGLMRIYYTGTLTQWQYIENQSGKKPNYYDCLFENGIVFNNSKTKIQTVYDDSITHASIPESVKNIGACAFEDCIELSKISIPDSVISIGNGAFLGCSNLSNVIIPDKVLFIGESAFSGCVKIDRINIPNGVKTIEKNTFKNCINIKEIYVGENINKIETNAFLNDVLLKTVYYDGSETDWDNLQIAEGNMALLCVDILYDYSTAAEYLPGDVSRDGQLSSEDARLALRGAVGLEKYEINSVEFLMADVDHDHLLSAGDARIILRAAVGLEELSLFSHYHRYEKDKEIAPTCEEEGLITKTCVVCHKESTIVLPAKGHAWISKTGVNGKVCSVCGKTECQENGHQWKDATCTQPKTCTVCGITEGKANGHNWDGGKTDIEATCTKTGLVTYTCTVCKTTKSETIKAKDHQWNVASCTVAKKCSVCGATDGKPLGHSFEKGVVKKAATCTAKGSKVFTCTRCKTQKTEDIPALGHSWSPATCTKAQYCTRCKTTQGKALGHSYTSTIIAPTPSAQGYTLHTCTRCGYSYKDNYKKYQSATVTYVCNKKTKKLHRSTCPTVKNMKAANKWVPTGYTREQLINMGYTPCKDCKP